MGKYGMKAVEFGLKYRPMEIEKRRSILPHRSVSSLYPAKADEDVLVTANGRQRIDIVGEPYHERVIYRRERIMDMRWKDTPEPPDVAYAIPEARKFLREGKVYPHYCWTACLGWIYNEFWGHYLVTGDKDFLRERVVPGLKEIALFYEDYLSDEDENGKVIFYPSYSPEDPSMNDYHVPFPKDVYAMNVNSLMDVMVCREVLDNLMEACGILGLEEPDYPKWKELRGKLPDYLLDEDGAVKEWSFRYSGENYDHRHVSHHYDIWPGRAISPEKTPELVKPFILSNRKRGHQDDSAHGVVHRYFTAVRLGDLPDAMHNLRTLMEHGYVTRTLNTVHYPYRVFCPDLLGAMPAMLLEMFVYSDEGFIKLLPAVPKDLEKGSLEGVWLYTFAKIERMEWDMEAGKASAVISSMEDQKIEFSFPIGYKELHINGERYGEAGNNFTLQFKKGEKVELDFIYTVSLISS